MPKLFFDSMDDFTHTTGERVGSVNGSVVAGVGNRLLSAWVDKPLARPDIDDPTSEESYERYKEYNVETNLRANTRRMWAGLIDRLSGHMLTGAAAGISVVLLGKGTGAAAAASGGWAAAAIFAVALAVSLVSFFFLHQTATKDVTAKTMDVNDYQLKRSAALVAQEIKKTFAEEGLKVQTVDEKSATTNTSPPNAAQIQDILYQGTQIHGISRQIH
jgi:hypothetical protein